MFWYPEKPEGGIRKPTRRNSREDERNAPTSPGEAAFYWSRLSQLYSRTSDYYMDVSFWWLKFAGVFLVVGLIAQVVALLCLVGS